MQPETSVAVRPLDWVFSCSDRIPSAYPEAQENTVCIAERCDVKLKLAGQKNPHFLYAIPGAEPLAASGGVPAPTPPEAAGFWAIW